MQPHRCKGGVESLCLAPLLRSSRKTEKQNSLLLLNFGRKRSQFSLANRGSLASSRLIISVLML